MSDKVTSWNPQPGWLMCLPVQLENKTGSKIIIPEEAAEKTDQGRVVKIGDGVPEVFMGKEIFFPRHSEYQVEDTDTEQKFFLVQLDQIILWRKPPERVRFFETAKRPDQKHD